MTPFSSLLKILCAQHGTGKCWCNMLEEPVQLSTSSTPLTLSKSERFRKSKNLQIAYLKWDQTNHLPNKLEFSIVMKTMVLMNISMDSDLANRSRGIIKDIIPDPRETLHPNNPSSVILNFPPLAFFFRPLLCPKKKSPGLDNGVIPIYPMCKTFKLGGRTGTTIERIQIPITPTYTFTDLKSQGQMIETVIVDLAKPPTGTLSSFNAYVALSQSRGRNYICLLRDFDDKIFTTHPNEDLRKEDKRLGKLERETLSHYQLKDISKIQP